MRVRPNDSDRQLDRWATGSETSAPGDFVKVECVCGHSMLIPPSGLLQGLRLPPYTESRHSSEGCRTAEVDPKLPSITALADGRVGRNADVQPDFCAC